MFFSRKAGLIIKKKKKKKSSLLARHLPTNKPIRGHFLLCEPMSSCFLESVATEEETETLMSLSSSATSCCLFDFQPSSLVFESQGGSVSYPCWEKKGDLVYLKEHAGLRGLFPQRGDMRVSVTHKALSLALLPYVVREPSFDFSPFLSFIMLSLSSSSPFSVFFHFFITATISSRFLPPSIAPVVPPYRDWRIAWFGGWLLFQSHP